MPQSVDPFDELSAAKRKLISAAGEVDPLRSLREKPYVLVGTAALMGAVLGSSRGTIAGGTMKLASGTLKLVRPLATVFSRFMLSRLAHHHEAQAKKDAEAAEEHAAVAAAHAAAASADPTL